MTVTTIKVSGETRDSLKEQATATGQTLGAYLTQLADKTDREARFAAIHAAHAATAPAVMESYWRETCDWLDADLGS